MPKANIVDDLQALAVPIDSLVALPDNPRIGDIELIAASYKEYGQRKPIVARKSDSTIIAGNHQWQAAQLLGWKEIAVVWVDEDEERSLAFALADNRSATVGRDDTHLLIEMLDRIDDSLPTGYDDLDREMLRDLFAADDEAVGNAVELAKQVAKEVRNVIVIKDVPDALMTQWYELAGENNLDKLEALLDD